MLKPNPVKEKSFIFALVIVRLYKEIKEKGYYDIASQLLRSGTSIGANINESLGTNSRKDFAAKMFISLKEARESLYWLELVSESKIINRDNLPMTECDELIKILVSICKTTNSRK